MERFISLFHCRYPFSKMSAIEELHTFEKMMACCFPCGLVWMKEGTGSACCCNILLGAVFGICCVNICHACKYVDEPGGGIII